MNKTRNKKTEISGIRRELFGERTANLTRIAGDTGTDEGERRMQLIWQHFRIHDCTKASAYVLGTEHPQFCEGKEAAAGNSAELFESELYNAGIKGVSVDRLSLVYSHYFGSGFERVVGQKLRAFVKERFDYDDATGMVKASSKVIDGLRKIEARGLMNEEKDYQWDARQQARTADKQKKRTAPPGMLSTPADIFDPDKRPRYATTKMTPDECEEHGALAGKGMGKGMGMF